MSLNLTAPEFHDMDAAREWLRSYRWPNGPFCPHCGSVTPQRMGGDRAPRRVNAAATARGSSPS